MEEERERHSCAVAVIQNLETCDVRGGEQRQAGRHTTASSAGDNTKPTACLQ